MVIKIADYPHILRAFNTVLYDQRGQAVQEIELDAWKSDQLDIVETVLKSLTEEDFENFCIGPEEEYQEIAERSKEHELANNFMSDLFDTL
jgi:hypothetical protein